MVKRAAGKLVLIADRGRDAAPVERSGHAPALVAHSNDDVPRAAVALATPPGTREEGARPRDPYAMRGISISVLGHAALAAAIIWFVPGAPEAPPLLPVQMIFAEVQSDEQIKDEGKPAPVQPAEMPVVEEPPPPPPQAAEEPTAPVSEPTPPEPLPPPVVEKAPDPPPPPEPEPAIERVEAPPPPPPPPDIKAEKPPEPPKVRPRPRPSKVVKPVEPAPTVVTVSEPSREEAPPARADAGQAMDAPQAAAPEIRQDKVPQEAAELMPSIAPIVSAVKFRDRTPPVYPPRAKDMNVEGVVVVEVWIDANGNPTNVLVIQSSGSSLLDEAARRGAWRWTFWPTQINGRAASARAHVPVPFKLTK